MGRTLHIEMQRENYTHFQKRCLFYLCRNYTRSLKRGEGYASLSPIVSISLLGFDLFEGRRGPRDFALMNLGTGRRLMEADDLLLFYVELNKAACLLFRRYRSGSDKSAPRLWQGGRFCRSFFCGLP